MGNIYPLQVGLVSPGEMTPYCGGSIITSRHILTAAHCTFDKYTGDFKVPSSIQVVVGEHNTADSIREVFSVVAIRKYPLFDYENGDYDIAMLVLSTPITFSSTAAPICLPASTQSQYSGQTATVTGWGDTSLDGPSSPTLQEVDVTVVDCSSYGSDEKELVSSVFIVFS